MSKFFFYFRGGPFISKTTQLGRIVLGTCNLTSCGTRQGARPYLWPLATPPHRSPHRSTSPPLLRHPQPPLPLTRPRPPLCVAILSPKRGHVETFFIFYFLKYHRILVTNFNRSPFHYFL